MSSSNAAPDPPLNDNEVDENHPLWRYVTKLDKTGDKKGGNVRFQCNLCNKISVGSYYRVKSHLLKIKGGGIASCSKVTAEIKLEMEKLLAEVNEKNKKTPIPLPTFSSQDGSFASQRFSGFESNKRKAPKNSALEKAFNNEAREHLKSEIARMFYSSGLPFHFARNPYYMSSYSFAASHNISGFVPPSYNALRTTLLQKERAHIERLLEPIKGTWKEKGVSLVTDGWTDVQRRPLINFMAVTESGPMFLRAVNCEGEIKDKFFIAGIMKETIQEIGPQNMVQVVTDNAPVCKAAGMLIEAQYAHIFWTPCVVHSLNLALKNICAAKHHERNSEVYAECHWITIVIGDAVVIKNYIANHSMRLAMFNEFVSLKLLSVAETRFASAIVMLKRFKLIKCGLQAMVISEKWSSYREDDSGKAKFVKDTILSDIWWDDVDYILSFTNPIYDMLRIADTDKPVLHLVYDMWDTMIEKVRKAIYKKEKKKDNVDSDFYRVVHSILADRWNKSSSPLHCLAHSLNPRYYNTSWLGESANHIAPHRDLGISEERNKCFRRYFSDTEDRQKAILEYARFSGGMDVFSSYDSLHDRGALDPKSWWLVYGASAPLLQTLALKLLGQPCSSSCSERNWSTYSFIHSIQRNKIQPQRAEDLVFVHTNLRLLSRKNKDYTKGEGRMWDVAGDVFEPFDGAGELEIAELSLDEPDLEAVLFAENEMSGDNDELEEVHEN